MMVWAALATAISGVALVSVASSQFRRDRELFCQADAAA
jgi:hypothetical protein